MLLMSTINAKLSSEIDELERFKERLLREYRVNARVVPSILDLGRFHTVPDPTKIKIRIRILLITKYFFSRL